MESFSLIPEKPACIHRLPPPREADLLQLVFRCHFSSSDLPMPRIRQLPTEVINQIAAGEVIERPASIVKELVENSLDALATSVEVDIERGGIDLVRVTDDGEGMSPEDLPLAVTSHATSKIGSSEDLFRIRTMGFRGEALASIASVSQFRIRSRTATAEMAHEMVATGREHNEDPRPTAGAPGTMVEVRDLFFNTPVRRKFLKTVSTEFGHICEQFTRIALANPRLRVVLRHNDREVFSLPSTDRLLDRLVLFHGSELAEKLIWVESEMDGIHLWGYVGHPSLSKPSRKGQYLFVNGRWIQDRALQHALGEAYRGLQMVGRYPISYLFLEIPPELVDVNVHPTKSEVRFEDGSRLYRQLLSTIRTRFLSLDFESPARLPKPGDDLTTADSQNLLESDLAREDKQRQVQAEFAAWATTALANLPAPPADEEIIEGQWHAVMPPTPSLASDLPTGDRSPVAIEGSDDPRSANEPGDQLLPADFHQYQASAGRTAQFAPAGSSRVMQVLDTYLVLETEKGLTLIDQHALHERIMYEHLRPRALSGAVEIQRLLAPEPVELTAKEAALLLANQEVLRQTGYVLEEFGRNTVLLAGYPAMLSRADHHALLRDIADGLSDAGPPSRRDLLDRLLHMMSCKAAIKAGQRLTDEEIQSLVAQRHLVDDAHHCPHGRPTALFLSRDQLDRQFGRLG